MSNYKQLLPLLFLVFSCSQPASVKQEQEDAKIVMDASLEYIKYDSLSTFNRRYEKEDFPIASIGKELFVYRDKNSNDIRIGLKKKQSLATWKILDASEAYNFTCNLKRVNFDNKGQLELQLQYRVRTLYSSFVSVYSGATEIWNLDTFEKYFEVTDYEAEMPERNGEGEFTECEYAVDIFPMKIIVRKKTGDCPATEIDEQYCLVDNAVINCQ